MYRGTNTWTPHRDVDTEVLLYHTQENVHYLISIH